MPFKQLIADTNPSFAHNYLNRMAKAGGMLRLKSRLKDNPVFFDHVLDDWTPDGKEYLSRLEHLTGAQRKRLLDGDWVTAEGMVFDEYDPGIHILSAKTRKDDQGRIWLDVPWGQAEAVHLIPPGINGDGTGYWPVEMQWFIGGKDFGWNAAGCFQVWGVNGKGAHKKLFRLAEVYRTHKQYEWWAGEISKLHAKFPFNRVIADCAEPRGIEVINDRLTSVMGRSVDRIVMGSDKSTKVAGRNYKLVSLDQLRWLISPDQGGPRMFLVADALDKKDPALALAEMPTCMEEELAGFVLEEKEDGQMPSENPDPDCPNHAIDAAKYMAMHVWRKDLTPEKKIERWKDKPGTMGQRFDHDILERQELGLTMEEWDDYAE